MSDVTCAVVLDVAKLAGWLAPVSWGADMRPESDVPVDEIAELRGALKALQEARTEGDDHRAEVALERALLTTSAAGIDTDTETVAAAVRLLHTADDNGTTRLEVRDQAMTHRRWFEVNAKGDAKWGNR
jgi:hypothetical protein